MRTKEHSVIVENLASAHLESWLIPDPYHFTVSKDGKLLFPGTGKPVENYVAKDTPVQKAEHSALVTIEAWARENTNGYVLWVSPPHLASGYELAKFTVSVLSVDGVNAKRLENTAVLNDLSAKECLKIANKISSVAYINPELLRSNPIFLEPPQGMSIIDFLRQYIPPASAWEQIKTGAHYQEKEKARVIYAEKELVNTETLRSGGANPNGRFSCPLGAYDTFLLHSYAEGWHAGNCRVCKRNTEVGPCQICKSCEPFVRSLPLAA